MNFIKQKQILRFKMEILAQWKGLKSLKSISIRLQVSTISNQYFSKWTMSNEIAVYQHLVVKQRGGDYAKSILYIPWRRESHV